MKNTLLITGLFTVLVSIGCSEEKTASGISSESSTASTVTTNQCTSPSSAVVDYGFRRTAGAALNVRGAFSDTKLIPGTNYPALVFNETNTTVGDTMLKYQFWDGDEFKTETIAGGLTITFVRLVFLSTGRPLVFWGNGATALYMASRSTASTSTEGTWTVSVIDASSGAIRAIEASVNPNDQVIVSFAANTTSSFIKASICTSNCHLAVNYAAMTNDLDSTAGTAMNSMGIGWCNSGSAYYPMVLYSDTGNAVLTMCRDATLSNCTNGTNWTTDITLTGSGANLVATQLYTDATSTDSTVYMVAKLATGLRPYTYATCATNVAATSADVGTNFVSNTGTVGNAYFNLGFGDGTFHVVANDAQTMIRYFNQPTASFATGAWRASTAPHVETTGLAGLAGAGSLRGGMAVDTSGDQILASYGRTLAVTPTQTFGNLVLAYNDCPSGLGAPACSSSTLSSDAASTAMTWGNMPADGSGQIGRNILQVPSTAISATSTGTPAAAYVDFSVGISIEPVTGALLKYAWRNGSTASSKWMVSVIPTTSAPQSPGLAFDHQDLPWVSWYETASAVGGFRYYLANNSRQDGTGLWTVYAYPISDAAAPALPVMNQTAVAMHYSGGVAKPVMIILRNPAANKGVHAARFNPATNQWDYQQQIISLAGTTTPGGAWLTSSFDKSGNIAVAVHDLGTGAGATCAPNTTRCIRMTYSTNGGSTWASAGQVYSGAAEGLDIKINPKTSRPAVSFYNRSVNVIRYKYCSTALASCTTASNWADVDTGVVDSVTGTSGLIDNGATANAGLMDSALSFSSDGYPTLVWSRGAGAIVSANLMFSTLGSTSGVFSAPATLKAGAFGNEYTPLAANAGNHALNWNAKSVRTSKGSLHTVHVGPGNFLYVTSCGD